MDKPRANPRKGNTKTSRNKRRSSTSSESHEVQELKVSDDGDENPDRDDDNKSWKNEDRPSSSKKGRRSRHQSDGHSSQPQPGTSSGTNAARPSSSSGRRSRLRSRQREETFSVEDDDDLHTSDFKRQLERLERDLTRRDRELEEEREENERCMDRVKKLERDKVELKREVEGLRDEAEDYKRTLEDYKDRVTKSKKQQGPQFADGSDLSEEDVANHNTFQTTHELSLMQKNKEIERLIEDIEKSEEEKQALQGHLTNLKNSLSDATKQIESMAHDHFNLKSKIQKSDERIRQLEEENAIVMIRETELKDFKERHDRYMDNLTTAVDQRIAGWKKIMFDKDEEIERLNMKISALMAQMPNTLMDSERTTIQLLNKKLMDREQHIILLNEQLSQATEEIDSNLRVIEHMQSKVTISEDSERIEKVVKSLQLKLQKCEERLERKCKQVESSEREAEEKSKELTSLICRMRAYESGEYGLPEAVSELKDLKHQIRVRDSQIESLTQDINVLQMQVADYRDENDMLRDKIGIDEEEDISKDAKRYAKNRKNELYAIRRKVSQLEEEIIQLKSRNYSLKKQVNELDALASQGLPAPHKNHDGPEKLNIPNGDRDSSSRADDHRSHRTTPTPTKLTDSGEAVVNGMTEEVEMEGDEWRQKYETLLEENSALRNDLREVLDSVQVASKASDLEERRIRLENTLELKESLTSVLNPNSVEAITEIPLQSISSTHMPLLATSSLNLETILPQKNFQDQEVQTDEVIIPEIPQKESQDCEVQTDKIIPETPPKPMSTDIEVQTVEIPKKLTQEREVQTDEIIIPEAPTKNLLQDNVDLQKLVAQLRVDVAELELILKAKQEVINEMIALKSKQEKEEAQRSSVEADLKDALVVARETVGSLKERLRCKEDSLNQYRKLLSDVRAEMTNATDRHVQEMKALQMTIHQQQQSFTRMKSTLSQPVRDIATVEGTIKDQLTRIHELEDEVNELQHAMSNTASQLTAARSEAHRWRCVAEARIKEVDSAREQLNAESVEEMNSLRLELRELHKKLEESQQHVSVLKSSGPVRDSMTELVNVLRSELEEKDKQIDAYVRSLHELRNSLKHSETGFLEEKLEAKDKEVESLKEAIKEHTKTIAVLNVKVSKSKAISYKTGASAELEELKLKHRDLLDEKAKLEKELSEFQARRDDEERKRTKTAEGVARWEESKTWKKKVEKLESRIKELELETDKTKRTLQSRVISITRLEKEKMVLEAKLNNRMQQSLRGNLSMADRLSDSSSVSSQQVQILAQGEMAKLHIKIQDLEELVEKTEFEGREEAEKLKMEVKLLKDRIVTQERQLTAYQIAHKGDNQAVTEIESMAVRESQLQKEIRRLEEDNLHLNLQIEQLRLDTPRLRDRVQHLQRLVDALKAENPSVQPSSATGKSSSQKSLSELEKTINALKTVIDKLQTENKRLKSRPASTSGSNDRLKSGVDSLLDEKKSLMDTVQSLEHENEKLKKRLADTSTKMEVLQARLTDAEKRAQSAEMKLRTFLGEQCSTPNIQLPPRASSSRSGEDQVNLNTGSSYDALLAKMRSMQEELDCKGRLLKEAKQSLKAVKFVTPQTDPVRGGGEIPSFPRHVHPIPESSFESDA